MCYFHSQQKGIEIWARPILPVYKGKYSYAIVFLNRRTDGTPSEVSIIFVPTYHCIYIAKELKSLKARQIYWNEIIYF